MSRLELADYLTNLGEQLRQGAFSAQGRHWRVPDNPNVRMEFKEKKGHLAAKLSWSWSTLGDYDRAAREEVTRGQDSMKTLSEKSFGGTGILPVVRTGWKPVPPANTSFS